MIELQGVCIHKGLLQITENSKETRENIWDWCSSVFQRFSCTWRVVTYFSLEYVIQYIIILAE